METTRAARLAPGAGRGHAEPAGGAGRPVRPHGRLRRRADRDGLSRDRPGPSSSRANGGRRHARPCEPHSTRPASGRTRWRPIGLDCTACTVVACDDDGEPLCPALLWMDQRAFREAADISATGDPVLRYVSGRVSPEWMLPEGALAQAEQARALSIGRPDRRRHRLDDAPADRRMDACRSITSRSNGTTPGRTAAGRSACCGRSGSRTCPRNGRRGSCRWAEARAGSCRAAAEDLGLAIGHPGRPGRHRRLPGDARPGRDPGRRRGGDRRLEHLPPRAVARGRLRLGSGRLLSRRDGRGTLHARGRPDGDRLDPRLVPPPLRRGPAAGGRAARRPRLRGAGRAGRGGAAGLRGPGRPRRLAGQPLALQEPAGPRRDRRASRWPTAPATSSAPSTRPRPAARGTSSRTPRPMACASSASSSAAAARNRALWLQIHADILKKPIHLARESEACALGSAMAAAVAAGHLRRLRRGRPRDGRHRAGRRARPGQRRRLRRAVRPIRGPLYAGSTPGEPIRPQHGSPGHHDRVGTPPSSGRLRRTAGRD